MKTAAVIVACTTLFVACGPVAEPDQAPGSGGKEDGFYFDAGTPRPRSTAGRLGTTFEDQFLPGPYGQVADHYVAYEVQVAHVSKLTAAHRFSTAARVGQALAARLWSGDFRTLTEEYGLRMILFKLDERAPAHADPIERWAAISAFDGADLEADVMPGTYMILLSVSDQAYADELRSFTDIALHRNTDYPPTRTRAPRVKVTVVTTAGYPAAEIRVALGTASAMTDEAGVAMLEQVEPGVLLGKIGPAGVMRGIPESVTIFSWLDEPHVVFTIDHQQYCAATHR